jgi:hypothetical protein
LTVPATDLLDVTLTELERRVLLSGINEWGGPARCTEEFAVAMGFRSVADLLKASERLHASVKAAEPLAKVDWVRVLLMTEIAFASDVVGSGWDWRSTVGVSDGETIALIRSVQRKIPKAGIIGAVFGTPHARPSRSVP